MCSWSEIQKKGFTCFCTWPRTILMWRLEAIKINFFETCKIKKLKSRFFVQSNDCWQEKSETRKLVHAPDSRNMRHLFHLWRVLGVCEIPLETFQLKYST